MAPSKHPPTDYSQADPGPVRIEMTPIPDTDTTASLGSVVRDAATHMSTLVRSEIELAKIEVTASVKQAVRGSALFAAAAAIALFSLFFFWFMIGEILDIWLPRWAAFTIVFGAMLLMAGLLVALGIRRVKKIKKPELTIAAATDTAAALKNAASRS